MTIGTRAMTACMSDIAEIYAEFLQTGNCDGLSCIYCPLYDMTGFDCQEGGPKKKYAHRLKKLNEEYK